MRYKEDKNLATVFKCLLANLAALNENIKPVKTESFLIIRLSTENFTEKI